jgi:hypothetical protein
MKNFIKKLFSRTMLLFNKNEKVFPITGSISYPTEKVNYRERMMVKRTLEKLSVGGSFPIRNELTYTVRKMVRDQFPEYRITIRNYGTSMRVFRAA